MKSALLHKWTHVRSAMQEAALREADGDAEFQKEEVVEVNVIAGRANLIRRDLV
jgi:hypothetical protein